MIRLGTRPDTPKTLILKKVKKTKEEIEAKIKKGDRTKSTDFISHWRGEAKKSISRFQHGKCCYCERSRDPNGESDVEHFRPKTKVGEAETHPGYWWLAYHWDNYFFCCKSCNVKKGTQFPLLPGGKRAFNESDDLKLEQPVLLHPIEDDPEKFISFDWQQNYGSAVRAVGLDADGRGFQTVNHLTAINKVEVMKQRSQLVRLLQFIVDIIRVERLTKKQDLNEEHRALIEIETRSDKEFAGFRRAFFRAAGLGQWVSKQ